MLWLCSAGVLSMRPCCCPIIEAAESPRGVSLSSLSVSMPRYSKGELPCHSSGTMAGRAWVDTAGALQGVCREISSA